MIVTRRRISRKLAILMVTPVLLGFFLFGVLQLRLWEQALLEDAERQLSDHAATIRAMIRLSPSSLDAPALSRAVQDISDTEQVHGIAFYNREWAPMAMSKLLEGGTRTLSDIVRKTSETGQPYKAVERISNTEVLLYVEPLRSPSGLSAFVITHSLAPVQAMLRALSIRTAVAGGILSAVLLILAVMLSKSLGKSLGALVHATEHVATGDFRVLPMKASGLLDLSRVFDAFNTMVRVLRETRERLDVSERARRSMERKILHAQALAAAGQVTGAFAHEIGSPLNTILGLARLSASNEQLPEATRNQMEKIAVQCERITRIVQRMLGVVRIASDKQQPVRIAEVIGDVAAFLEADLKTRGIDIHLDISAAPKAVMGSRDLMFQVLLNLCNNAADAQPGGGFIRISCRSGNGQEKNASRADTVIIEVADAGPGIQEEHRDRIFEPFYSTKAVQGGTGLGLSIVASIVRDAGGSIRAAQAPEGGALFEIVLPAV